jgi:hypothetical protein
MNSQHNKNMTTSNFHIIFSHTLPYQEGRVGKKIIPQKNTEKIKKFIKYFVEMNKNEVNKNCRQKTKENV